MPTRIIVVDDSPLMRRLIATIIDGQPDLRCIGEAADPLQARELIRQLSPDVITLDVEMPRMDGLDFLERLMRLRPMPVVMVSTLTAAGTDATLRALELGAVDFLCKPTAGQPDAMAQFAAELVDKLRVAAAARVRRHAGAPPHAANSTSYTASSHGTPAGAATAARVATLRERMAAVTGRAPLAPSGHAAMAASRLLCIGASTGGTEALHVLLGQLPATLLAGVVVVQHMPARFTPGFSRRLDAACAVQVREAAGGEVITAGSVWIAPGGRHLRIARSGSHWVTVIDDEEPVNRHRPSVDVLFRSAARLAGNAATGVLLTGMGVDGAAGLLEMRRAGAHTVAQDEASCVVWGMPREAVRLQAACEVLPLERIAPSLLSQRLPVARAA